MLIERAARRHPFGTCFIETELKNDSSRQTSMPTRAALARRAGFSSVDTRHAVRMQQTIQWLADDTLQTKRHFDLETGTGND